MAREVRSQRAVSEWALPPGESVEAWRRRALRWAVAHYDHVLLFNGNRASLPDLNYPEGTFPDRLAVGAYRIVDFSQDGPSQDGPSQGGPSQGGSSQGGSSQDGNNDPFEILHRHFRQQPDYLVGYLGYDLKNAIEPLRSRHPDRVGIPPVYFFQPLHLIDFEDRRLVIRSWTDPEAVRSAIRDFSLTSPENDLSTVSVTTGLTPGRGVQTRVSKEIYLENVRRIQEYIRDGEVYELNYCLEFFAEGAQIDPLAVYTALNARSPMPFSVFQRLGDFFLLGASPERFFKKTGSRILSQPIKGTIRRGDSAEEDEMLKRQLQQSEKERAENLMIVDLVRNDLARSAQTGSVRVDELFGVYSFRQVHQLISTVSATLRPDVPFTSALRNAFPMGSMTGAPKVRAMELIDELEAGRRGLYAGAVGYITPEGDLDFNVVIRSMQYQAARAYLTFSVGSAITIDSEPEEEYRECLLKAQAMRAVLREI